MFLVFLQDPIYEHSYEKKSCLYWIFKCLFLLLFSNYCHARKSIPVTDDDNILRNHKKFFTYQGWIMKYIPNSDSVLKSIQGLPHIENSNFMNKSEILSKLNHDLVSQLSVATQLAELDMNIVEKQEFKNIQINDGSRPFYLYFLLHYLVIIDLPFILLSSIFSLFDNNILLAIGYYSDFISNIFVMVCFPLINYQCLKIKTIFGTEQEDSILFARFKLFESRIN